MSKKKNKKDGDEPEKETSEGSNTEGTDVSEIEIVPKKDWLINCPPTFIKQLKQDEPATVPKQFVQGLRTEGVID